MITYFTYLYFIQQGIFSSPKSSNIVVKFVFFLSLLYVIVKNNNRLSSVLSCVP